jgi:SAM-dependent methyltransferase
MDARTRGWRTVAPRTLDHYEANADRFWEGTRDHDVSQNLDALLSHISAKPPFRILDFGCGPGRDLLELRRRGHVPVGLDGCSAFCRMAREYAGCQVLEQDFLALELPKASFGGIFANASLFHVPSAHLPRVLSQLADALEPGGVLVASNPRGDGREGWNGDRYGCYFELEGWRELFSASALQEITHYYRPKDKPRHEQPWLVTVWRRAA